eukprot:COSAG01_NODE_64209_length_277_cov_0.870787_1_plen_37_part_10
MAFGAGATPIVSTVTWYIRWYIKYVRLPDLTAMVFQH